MLSANYCQADSASLACNNLSYNIGKKAILHHVNLHVNPGEILIVSGPCNAGKTTLLNLIAFRIKRGTKSGQILLNREDAKARTFKRIGRYVMTEGRMLPYFTVYETLMTVAKLKVPDVSVEDQKARVEAIISELALENCRNTYIGGEWKKGISTGTKRWGSGG